MQDILTKAFYSFMWCLCITVPLIFYLDGKMNRRMLIFTLSTFIVCFTTIFLPKPFEQLITLSSIILLLLFLYKQPILSSIRITFIWLFSSAIGEMITIYILFILFKFPEDSRNEDVFVIFIIYLGILVVSIMVLWLMKNIKFSKHYFIEHIKAFSVVIISITIILFLALIALQVKIINSLSVNNIIYVYISAIILLFLFILINAYIFSILIHNKYRVMLKENEYKSLLLYTQSIEELSKDIRKQQHDYNNFVLAVRGYVEQSDYYGLKNFFLCDFKKYNCGGTDSSYNSQIRNISDSGLRGILAVKLSSISKPNIEVEIDIASEFTIPESISKIDIYRIMGILLDNAAEAVKDRFSFAITHNDSEISFKITNDFIQKPNMKILFASGYSTKGRSRGLGLPNVREIIKKYENMEINTYLHEYIFVQEVIIKL